MQGRRSFRLRARLQRRRSRAADDRRYGPSSPRPPPRTAPAIWAIVNGIVGHNLGPRKREEGAQMDKPFSHRKPRQFLAAAVASVGLAGLATPQSNAGLVMDLRATGLSGGSGWGIV